MTTGRVQSRADPPGRLTVERPGVAEMTCPCSVEDLVGVAGARAGPEGDRPPAGAPKRRKRAFVAQRGRPRPGHRPPGSTRGLSITGPGPRGDGPGPDRPGAT